MKKACCGSRATRAFWSRKSEKVVITSYSLATVCAVLNVTARR